ncbi:MAG: penicillin acylase family protein [Deltaproteobacteria bacterium]|nr:penicillin acylase family protein [Deltaproteobacteria bacterium]
MALAVACGKQPESGGADAGAAIADAAQDATGDLAGTAGGDAVGDATTAGNSAKQALILGVPLKAEYDLPLSAEAHVVRTEGDVAHIYAKNRKDLSVVAGFVLARHRYFQMELTRRLGLGEISALLGDAALEQDIEARLSGSLYVADAVQERLTPELADVYDGFAAGINAYIDLVVAGKQAEPSEIKMAKGMLGGTAESLMKKWDRRSVAGASAAIVYNLGYETDDVGRTEAIAALPAHYKDKPLAELRLAGALADIEYLVKPIKPVSSAAGSGLDLDGKPVAKTEPGKVPAGKDLAQWLQQALLRTPKPLPAALSERHKARDTRWQRRSGHDRGDGFGSNAWAVAGKGAVDGAGLLAGDGHLPLSVPSLFYQIGLDTRVFGGGATHQKGLMIPGLPLLAVGTNGGVAWSQTQLVGDITDWYRDQVVLDKAGKPIATRYLEAGKLVDRPLKAVEETLVVAEVKLLGSKGRTEKWTRYVTWDGRWLTDFEGPSVMPAKYTPQPGETVVAVAGGFVVPKDQNGDGVVTGIAFDFTGLDKPNIVAAVDGFGHSADVWQLRDHTRKLVAYSQNIVAADSKGNALYTGYQAVPCRKHLPRDASGKWKPGADPKQLIDGTLYTGFEIPTLADGTVDESKGADPMRCVVPFDAYPQSVNPPQGFVVTGNNDPGNLSTDNDLWNDKHYIGGPWANGYRADSIAEALKPMVAGKNADIAKMGQVQAHNHSRLGQDFGPMFLKALADIKALATKGDPDPDELRAVQLAASITPAVLDDVVKRLDAWIKAGAPALSGVETFYHKVTPGEVDHAIATSIFNAWMDRAVALTVDDEGLDLWEPWGADARTRAMWFMWQGRGPGNPGKLLSWNPKTLESAFFDILSTAPVERSDEVVVLALKQGLEVLASKDKGFGSPDPAKWVWGMRHGVRFESILAKFLSGNDQFAPIANLFSITPTILPLADKYLPGDPRADLEQFPRPGDAFAVDAAGGIFNKGYGSGPVFRMAIALTPTKTTGENVIPGGQSGLTDSPFFADQVKAWLGNAAWPLRYEVEDVVAGAVGRESYK